MYINIYIIYYVYIYIYLIYIHWINALTNSLCDASESISLRLFPMKSLEPVPTPTAKKSCSNCDATIRNVLLTL